MRHHVPTTAGILTIVGGGFITGVDAFIVLGASLHDLLSTFGIAFLVAGPALAVLVIVMGLLILTAPQRKTTWAILAIVFSLPSLPFGFSGFVVGIVLVVVGAVLAIRYKIEPIGTGTPGPAQ
jgi:hypothetical protein